MKHRSLYWELRVLDTGPPGKSLEVNFEELEKYIMGVTEKNLKTWARALGCRGEQYQVARIPVILSGVIPSVQWHSSYPPHFMVEEIDLEKVRAVLWVQRKFQGRCPGLASLLELSLCTCISWQLDHKEG